MSKVNWRTSAKKYDKRKTEKAHLSSAEVLVDDGVWVPACDIKHMRKIQRRKVRHDKSYLQEAD